jgi:hypothetical protein
MTSHTSRYIFLLLFLFTLAAITSCSSVQPVSPDYRATPTPTEIIQIVPPTQTGAPSLCAGLVGEIEVQMLVGPAEVAGLEPQTAGSIPFTVTAAETPYTIQGAGDLEYYDEILVEDWGTYEVTMNAQITIDGDCTETDSKGTLSMALEMTGNQLVKVTSPDFNAEYPWEGTVPFDLVFPLEEGASFDGEGFSFVLHLK